MHAKPYRNHHARNCLKNIKLSSVKNAKIDTLVPIKIIYNSSKCCIQIPAIASSSTDSPSFHGCVTSLLSVWRNHFASKSEQWKLHRLMFSHRCTADIWCMFKRNTFAPIVLLDSTIGMIVRSADCTKTLSNRRYVRRRPPQWPQALSASPWTIMG